VGAVAKERIVPGMCALCKAAGDHSVVRERHTASTETP
jgi:hypothetical protein